MINSPDKRKGSSTCTGKHCAYFLAFCPRNNFDKFGAYAEVIIFFTDHLWRTAFVSDQVNQKDMINFPHDKARKFYERRNNNKVDSIETEHIVIAYLLL